MRGGAIADCFALNHAGDGEFDIFRQQMKMPPVVALDDLVGNQKARSGYGAACAQQHAGMVQVFCFAQKPQRIAGADPVGVIILGVSVACDNAVACVERLVHFGNIVFCQQVVGVENEEAFKGVFAKIGRDLFKGKV